MFEYCLHGKLDEAQKFARGKLDWFERDEFSEVLSMSGCLKANVERQGWLDLVAQKGSEFTRLVRCVGDKQDNSPFETKCTC